MLLRVLLALSTLVALARAESVGASPSTPGEQQIDWMQLGIVLGSLYAFTVLAVICSVCICRSRSERSPDAESSGDLQTTGSGVWGVRTITRAKSWHVARRGNQAGVDLSSIERSIKMGFVRKVYSILATQLGLTVAIVIGFIYRSFEIPSGSAAPDAQLLTPFGQWVLGNYFIVLISFIPLIMCICALQKHKNKYPINFVLLFVFTVLESISLGFLCVFFYASGYGSEILLSFGITMAIFCVLTLFTMQSKVDWSFLAPALFSCMFILIFWSWFTFFLVPASSFMPRQLISLAGAIIFCLFIVYDTNNIMKHFGVDDYIIAAIELYLDIINLFQYLLYFLSLSGGSSS